MVTDMDYMGRRLIDLAKLWHMWVAHELEGDDELKQARFLVGYKTMELGIVSIVPLVRISI